MQGELHVVRSGRWLAGLTRVHAFNRTDAANAASFGGREERDSPPIELLTTIGPSSLSPAAMSSTASRRRTTQYTTETNKRMTPSSLIKRPYDARQLPWRIMHPRPATAQ